jgi:hypothetical protein
MRIAEPFLLTSTELNARANNSAGITDKSVDTETHISGVEHLKQ